MKLKSTYLFLVLLFFLACKKDGAETCENSDIAVEMTMLQLSDSCEDFGYSADSFVGVKLGFKITLECEHSCLDKIIHFKRYHQTVKLGEEEKDFFAAQGGGQTCNSTDTLNVNIFNIANGEELIYEIGDTVKYKFEFQGYYVEDEFFSFNSEILAGINTFYFDYVIKEEDVCL